MYLYIIFDDEHGFTFHIRPHLSAPMDLDRGEIRARAEPRKPAGQHFDYGSPREG
jgi:hypothetical protein